ncbi:MAG: DNA polymerase III subunit beta [Pseudomonadota bacterium]
MKFIIEQKDFQPALAAATRVVQRRNTIPILSNVKVEASGETITITASDLDTEISVTAPAQVEAAGATTMPGHLLSAMVNRLPKGAQVSVSADDRMANIICGKRTAQLPILPVTNFPEFARSDAQHAITLAGMELHNLFSSVAYAISTEETRYYLCGIYMHVVGDDVAVVATDGHRLGHRLGLNLANENMLDETAPGVIIPKQAVQEINKLTDKVAADVTLSWAENHTVLTMDGVTLRTKNIEGNFPDYNRVIPSAPDKIITINREAVTDAASYCAQIAETVEAAKKKVPQLILDAGDNLLQLSAGRTNGTGTDEIEAQYEGENIRFSMGLNYLAATTASMDGDTIRMELTDPSTGILLRDPEDPTHTHVIMPMSF